VVANRVLDRTRVEVRGYLPEVYREVRVLASGYLQETNNRTDKACVGEFF
jgi:hypothetical protein